MCCAVLNSIKTMCCLFNVMNYCVFWLMIVVIRTSECYHISVEPVTSLNINGNIITHNNLHDYLETHEKVLLFGHQQDSMKPTSYKLVNVQHKLRSQRSIKNIVNLRINSNDNDDKETKNCNISSDINLKLHKSNKLIDENFVFIKRDENATTLVDNFDKLAERYLNCFYRNENSAMDLCDGNVRGIFHHNSQNLIIHPLPNRFGSTAHIIYETKSPTQTHLRPMDVETNEILFEPELNNFEPNNRTIHKPRSKRHIASNSSRRNQQILFIETAIFVDKDLFRHMAKNYPKNTEGNLIRFVLAMINGVQLLYHHPSLGHQINFMLKRLEILHTDPKELRRSSDIDVFLNSFCMWQRKFNPIADENVVHFDHAVILTGLDLYVVSKNGKVSSQVVGLAPVAGMCTTTSSCTINEGKHFESVFVVAHEIGHNLGMRHDTSESDCDPSLFIMSPTLGSGKITWSKCSQNYLKSFLQTSQARCLFDQGQFDPTLDHAAEGIFPGERFDADQQCMLKYGKDSARSRIQPLKEICRDLHCQRDRYTWTSHPALEGTSCGESKWCRSGVCVLKTALLETFAPLTRPLLVGKSSDKANLIDDRKYSSLMKQEYTFNRASLWSDWSESSECESGCLFGESGGLKQGSTGLKTFRRSCHDYRWSRKKCHGPDKKYEGCASKQCYNVPRTTVMEFANQICERAKKFDGNILGEGIQKVSNSAEESCKVYCKSKSGKTITKSWIFPDGTTCRNQDSDLDDSFYCVNGRCEKFTCENATSNYFRVDPQFCSQNLIQAEPIKVSSKNIIQQENGRDYKSLRPSAASLVQQIPRNDSTTHGAPDRSATISQKYKSNAMEKLRISPTSKHSRIVPSERPMQSEWIVKSGCHFSCMEQSKGIQIVSSKIDHSTNIQLCQAETIACDRLQTTQEFGTKLCKKYQSKVRGLSGHGMQIAPSTIDPDRGCKVACQDEYLRHRFYLVNGEQGYFPFGTKCSRATDNRYCVNGNCLEFGIDNVPLIESHISLALYRSKRTTIDEWQEQLIKRSRQKRNFLFYEPINITERIDEELLKNIIENIELSEKTGDEGPIEGHQIDLLNPIHITIDDY